MKKIFFNKNNSKEKIFLFSTIALFLVVAVSAFVFLQNFYQKIFPEAKKMVLEEQVKKEVCENCLFRKIDGVLVPADQENNYPIAIVMDNHPKARPLFGLSKANLVFEAEAEGGITRYLAFFANNEELDKIGPIRSARAYFLDWVHEFEAAFIHCGGSPEALARIIKEDIWDLNEFYNAPYFWRDKMILAPHNIFSSYDNLSRYLAKNNLKSGNYESWQFKAKEDIRESEIKNSNIKVNYFSQALPGELVVEWEYDKENNDYIRFLAGKEHKDADGSQIRAKNIIIQIVPAKVIDDKLRLKMDNIGTGEAVVCLDGVCEEGRWLKNDKFDRTRFYKRDIPSSSKHGPEFIFNPGTTWIEVVRSEIEVEY